MLTPLPVQWDVINSKSRYKLVVAGRRGGKSVLSMMLMYQKAAEKSNSKIWYVAPSYKMARNIMWEQLKSFLYSGNWVEKANESRLEITLVNGSTITLWGADNPDSMRGSAKLDYVVFDEAAFIKEEVWSKIVAPILMDNKGDATFITTPNGAFGWFYELYLEAKEKMITHPGMWFVYQYTTRQAGTIDQEEIDHMESNMSARQVSQELDANFDDIGSQVYDEFTRDYHTQHSDVQPYKDELIVLGTDFNYHPLVSVAAVLRVNGRYLRTVKDYHRARTDYIHGRAKLEFYVIDEIELPRSNTYELAKEIHQMYPGQPKISFPDPAGSANKSSAVKTDHEILRDSGITVIAHKSHPAILDRIAAVNKALRSSKGETTLWINKKCKTLIKGLEQHQYDEGTRKPAKKAGPDDMSHMNDALGYMIEYNMPVKNENISSGNLPRYGAA